VAEPPHYQVSTIALATEVIFICYDVAMTIQEVYRQFGTPKNLQQHMLTVTGLICSIQEHWAGEQIHWNHLIIAGLLHDLGNVIKFDLDKFPTLLGDELPKIDYWRDEQKRLIEKYSNDDHVATGKMLDELGIDDEVKEAIQTKSFGNIRQTAKSEDWLPKILQYCDLRTAPSGLMTLDERAGDLKERYDKYANRSDFSEMIEAAKSIENEIAQSVDMKLEAIITGGTEKYKEKLLVHRVKP